LKLDIVKCRGIDGHPY